MFETFYNELDDHLRRRGIMATQTKPEEFRDDVAAMVTIRIVRVPLEEEHRPKMCNALSRFLVTLEIPEQQKVMVRGKAKYSVLDRPARAEDVLGCNLFLHETKGHHKGETIKEPFVAVTLGSGMKYLLWLSGRPQRTCVFCKQHHEPIKRDQLTDRRFHMPCLEAAKRAAMAPDNAMTLDRRLLEQAAR